MKKILLATDFSANADNALEYALPLADAAKGEIILLHIYFLYLPSSDAATNMMMAESMEEESEKKLEKMAAGAKNKYPAVNISYMARMGSAAEETVFYAREIHADMIIAGARGKSNVADTLFGSTASGIIRAANCAVLVIPESAAYKPFKNILFACDYINLSGKWVLAELKFLANLYDSEILVFNVVKESAMASKNGEHGISAPEYLKEIPYTHTYTFEADTDEGIVHFIDEHKPDLLVMIPHQHSFLHRLLKGSHTQRISMRTNVPLLALPDRK